MEIDELRNALKNLEGGNRDWYKIKNQTATTAEIHIYDEISWFGVSAQDFIDQLKNITAENIELHLNSPGGSVFDGIAIMNALRFHSAGVTVYVDSLAASIASVIAMAGDEIVMLPGSQMMIHDAMGFARGNAQLMREAADLMDKQSANIASIYADRRGGTTDSWRSLMLAETWFNAEEAVAAGLADIILVDAQPAEDIAAKWDLSIFNYAGRAKAPSPNLQLIKNTAIENGVAGPHSTSVVEGTWSRSANEKNLPTPVPLAKARKFYTSWDDSAVSDGAIPKSAGHLPHHQVSADGNPGAAVRAGVIAAKARANQVKGGSGDLAAVLRHLRGHVPDADHSESENALLAEFGYVNEIVENNPEDNTEPAPEEEVDFTEVLSPDLMRNAVLSAAKEPFEFDPESFHAILSEIAGNAPAPPETISPEAQEEKEVFIDMSGLKDIIRKVAK